MNRSILLCQLICARSVFSAQAQGHPNGRVRRWRILRARHAIAWMVEMYGEPLSVITRSIAKSRAW
jgi:hypothetical protein